MKRRSERILTTHTGSIARPDDLIEMMREKENGRPYEVGVFNERVRGAVAECVRHQVDVGLDVINDGEQGKNGFTSYQAERLAGFDSEPWGDGPLYPDWKEVAEFPEYYERYMKTNMFGAILGPRQRMIRRGPVRYIGQDAVRADTQNLKAALEGQKYEEAFMSAALPTGLVNQENEYYSAGRNSSLPSPTPFTKSAGQSSTPGSLFSWTILLLRGSGDLRSSSHTSGREGSTRCSS